MGQKTSAIVAAVIAWTVLGLLFCISDAIGGHGVSGIAMIPFAVVGQWCSVRALLTGRGKLYLWILFPAFWFALMAIYYVGLAAEWIRTVVADCEHGFYLVGLAILLLPAACALGTVGYFRPNHASARALKWTLVFAWLAGLVAGGATSLACVSITSIRSAPFALPALIVMVSGIIAGLCSLFGPLRWRSVSSLASVGVMAITLGYLTVWMSVFSCMFMARHG